MANLKLVGAVAIKVRPDAKGFRRETETELEKELKGVKAKVVVEAELSEGEVESDAKKLEKKLDGKQIQWKVKLDHDSVRAAQKQFDSMLEPTKNIKFNLKDDKSIDKAREKLEKLAAKARVKMTYVQDEKGYQSVLDKIAQIRRQKLEVPIDFKPNSPQMDKIEKDMRKKLAQIPTTISYNSDAKGLQKVIDEINTKLAKNMEVEVSTTLDTASLVFTKARMEAELGKQKIEIEYEEGDLSSLKAARSRIMALLPAEHKLHISTEVNEASLLKALAEVDAKIKAATPEIKPKVEPKVETVSFLKVASLLAALTKNKTVDVFVRVSNASILLAAAKLTGLRAAGRWTEAFAKSLGTLDRNLPIVAATVVGLNSMTSGVLSLTASAFSLGNELGTVVRMAALLAPAMILGFAAVKTVMQGVFKDFGAAVNGDDKAIEKLTESGKKAAANMRVIFQDIRETVSKNFWDEASDNMLTFTETALPQVRDGMAKLSTSMGGVFSSIVDATTKFAKEDGFTVFFSNLTRGFDNVKAGMGPFMSAFLNLAALGSTIFPRMGKAFEVMSTKFDAWVTGLAKDGTFNRWIDQGVQGIKDLWSAGVSLVGVWQNIGLAAQGAGALTLTSFARLMAQLDVVTNGYRFQTNLSRIFDGARSASDTFHASLGKLGPAMDTFSVTMSNALANSGKALGAFIDMLGDVLSSKNLDKGMTAFLEGVKTMFVELRPAAAPITEILRTFGEILGSVARDSGPLFRTLFTQLATVFTTAWHALEPFLPVLIQIGTTIVDTLGPALADAAEIFIPAFAGGLADLGDGLIPVIKSLADFAVGIVGMVADTPLPVIAGIVGGILALNTAFTMVKAVAPLAAAAMQLFGIEAGIAGARVQLMVPVIGIALAALAGLAIGGVAQMTTNLKSGTPHVNEYATALREDAKAAGEFGDAIGAATTKLAIKTLMDDGAYDAARKLGLSTWDVTDAVLHGGKAMDGLKSKLDLVQKGYDEEVDASKKSATGMNLYSDRTKNVTKDMAGKKQALDILKGAMDDSTGSIAKASDEIKIQTELEEKAGTATEGHADSVDYLTAALEKSTVQFGAAAAATSVLTDEFSSSSAKVDAMRKTFDLLTGGNAKQKAAETLGAYAKGFNDLKETVTPLAQDMRNLGDAVYGEEGFLNVAGGNKAVMQVNQALVDEVNNVWTGAKAAYDAAIKQGKTAQGAFEEAQKFISDHKGDYNALAEASGLSAERVQGQWDAVFGKEWVLQVSLQGATEAAAKAQAMVIAIKGNFDGKTFMAWLDANPDMALLAVSDADAVARAFVNHEWKANLDAAPQRAIDAIHGLKGLTQKEWNEGDFSAIMRVGKDIPGLNEALQAIRNGAAGDFDAIIEAIVSGRSVEEARRQLNALAATRTAYIDAVIRRGNGPDLNGDASGNGTPGIANGGIFRSVRRVEDLFKGRFQAGMFKAYANGGIERHVAQIASGRGPVRIWGESETQGEAYIPYAQSKRPRSLAILTQVARDFGYELNKASEFGAGGFAGHTGASTTNTASVTIGTLYTTDADEAVRKIRISQQDALAVAGITLNGA